MFEFTITDKDGITNPLRRFHWTAAVVAWADTVGPVVRDAIRSHAPVVTGRLRDSITYQRHTVIGGIEIEFGSNVPYAPYVVKGAAPHEIYPVAAMALHWNRGGGDHFAAHVHHPGIRPDDFPRKAVLPLVPMLGASLRAAVEKGLA